MPEQKNIYLAQQKEALLTLLSAKNFNTLEAQNIAAQEVDAIHNGQTTPDFLEIVPGSYLVETMRLMRPFAEAHISHTTSEKIAPTDAFARERVKRFGDFTRELERMIQANGDERDIFMFVQSHRKEMGMADSAQSLVNLAQLFENIDASGLAEHGEVMLLYYSGTFNPFPHRGHISVAESAHRQSTVVENTSKRVVVTANGSHPVKKDLAQSYPKRLDNLHRAFIDHNYITALGLAGDLADKKNRMKHQEILAKFDREGRVRFIVGSDNFLQRVEDARTGDWYGEYLFQPDHQIFVSPRETEDSSQILEAKAMVETMFGSNITLLQETTLGLSGTLLRTLPPNELRAQRPNRFVRYT